MNMAIDALTRTLWPRGNGPESPQVYALLDGARDDEIAKMVRISGLPYACLYAGSLSPDLQAAAPYLVQVAPESRMFKACFEAGWGRSWGVFVIAEPDVTLQALRKHFRSLLRVNDEQGKALVFRYYDPRVLRIYLPTCTPSERREFFGPALRLVVESGKPGDDQPLVFEKSPGPMLRSA
jgi:hypothetical protein